MSNLVYRWRIYGEFLMRVCVVMFCSLFIIGKVLAFGVTTSGGPQDGQQNVPPDALVDRTFSDAASGATVNTNTVTLKANQGNTQGGAATGASLCNMVVNEGGGTRVVCVHDALTASTWYTFTLSGGILTSTGQALTSATYAFQISSFAGGGSEFTAPPTVIGSVPLAGTSLPSDSLRAPLRSTRSFIATRAALAPCLASPDIQHIYVSSLRLNLLN